MGKLKDKKVNIRLITWILCIIGFVGAVLIAW
jgi:hypothetical protein